MSDPAIIRARWHDGEVQEAEEQWRSIASAEGYSVSSLGRVRRDAPVVLSGHIHPPKPGCIKPRRCSKRSNHLAVTLSVRGKRIDRLVHRLVAEAFIGPQPEGMPFVCHRDGDETHNKPSNLYWGTGTTNAADRTAHGRTLCGSAVANSKLTDDQVLSIREQAKSGRAQRLIAKEFGVSQSLVSMILTRQVWGHI